jgi:hypothetical protein
MRGHQCLPVILAVCGAALSASGAARAEDSGRIAVIEENDSLYRDSDKHFTQGLRLSYVTPDLDPQGGWNAPFSLAGDIAPIFAGGDPAVPTVRRFALLAGQSIFTPKVTSDSTPDPRERPYAGWLYLGAGLLQETDRHMLENLEIDFGVVGPGALGKLTQNDFHQFIGAETAKGWSHQLRNEPGVMLTYERLWRVPLLGDGDNGLDIVPQIGGTVGNVLTSANAGALLRLGTNLNADYGQARIRPGLSGSDYFNGDHLSSDLGVQVYAGFQGRAVGWNIFLDGNSFRDSPNVEKTILVADLLAGVSLFWSRAVRVDFGSVVRTQEFKGQGAPDIIGSASISFGL